jgi:hypothetical protein
MSRILTNRRVRQSIITPECHKSERPELSALQEAHCAAEWALQDARDRLNVKIGVSDKAEYMRLNAAADVAWQALNKAQQIAGSTQA